MPPEEVQRKGLRVVEGSETLAPHSPRTIAPSRVTSLALELVSPGRVPRLIGPAPFTQIAACWKSKSASPPTITEPSAEMLVAQVPRVSGLTGNSTIPVAAVQR